MHAWWEQDDDEAAAAAAAFVALFAVATNACARAMLIVVRTNGRKSI